MPGNKRPRKKYRSPGLTLVDRVSSTALPLRMASGEKLKGTQQRDILLQAHTSLANVERGAAVESDLHHLAFVSNVSLLLAERGMGSEYLPEVKEAQEHLVGLLARHARGESLLLSGPGLVSVRRLLELHDAQIEHEDMTEGLAYSAVHDVLLRMMGGNVFEIPK